MAGSKTKPFSIYIKSDVAERYNKFKQKYPLPSDSSFWNAAMMFYLEYAERGVDGNLMPYTLENGPKLTPMYSYEDITRAVNDYMKNRKSNRSS